MRRIGVLIVDDHEAIRAGIRTRLESDPDAAIKVLDESDSALGGAKRARELASDHSLQVVILDILFLPKPKDENPPPSGLDVIRQISQECPGVQIVIYSTYDDAAYWRQAKTEGARGYVFKGDHLKYLVDAVHWVSEGLYYLSPTMVHRDQSEERGCPLSERQMQVLGLFCDKRSYTEIASTLSIKDATVGPHLKAIKKKLGVSDGAKLCAHHRACSACQQTSALLNHP